MKKEKPKKFWNYFLKIILLGLMFLFFGLILGTIAHEVVGHGLTAVAFGNQLNAVKILIFQFDSDGFSFVPFSGFGQISWELSAQPTINSQIFTLIMASIVPLIVSIIFAFLLLLGKQRGLKKILFTCFAIWFIDPLCNYFIWPYLSGGGGDFREIINQTGFNLLPFTIIALASALIVSSVILYNLFSKNNPKIKKILLWLLIALTFSLIFYISYLVIFGNTMGYGGFKSCQKINDLKRMEGCAYSLAIANKDNSLCKTISETNISSDCYYYVAYWSENPTICSEVSIPEDKDSCFYWVADRTKNNSICNFITNKTFSDECLNEVA